MVWGLGSIAPYGIATVQLTVRLVDPIPLQLDNGARVYGNLNARQVSASTTAARLRESAAFGDYLKSTPDANITDPYILARAAELGNDPQKIFVFVRDEISYESYKGSLRGARGTLWSKAGNSLDQASLLVALLRASGIPARYVQGNLSEALSRDLILSMFPPVIRLAGYIQEDTELSDPASDLDLLEVTREHFWVELDQGTGFITADPTFPQAEIGQTFTNPTGYFNEVPDPLRHKVTVHLKTETMGALSSLAGGGADIAIPLEQTFNTVELVGKPLSLGHFVNTYSPPSMIFSYASHTYCPYILIAQTNGDMSDDLLIRGKDYEEFLTNFPLASQLLTGVFLEIDVVAPDGTAKTYTRTLVDRLGYPARTSGRSVTPATSQGTLPALTEFDVVTIDVSCGLQDRSALRNQLNILANLKDRLTGAAAGLDANVDPGPLDVSEAFNLIKGFGH